MWFQKGHQTPLRCIPLMPSRFPPRIMMRTQFLIKLTTYLVRKLLINKVFFFKLPRGRNFIFRYSFFFEFCIKNKYFVLKYTIWEPLIMQMYNFTHLHVIRIFLCLSWILISHFYPYYNIGFKFTQLIYLLLQVFFFTIFKWIHLAKHRK